MKSKRCSYSPSCFTCPMPDCVIWQKHAVGINRLETDWKMGTGAPRQIETRWEGYAKPKRMGCNRHDDSILHVSDATA